MEEEKEIRGAGWISPARMLVILGVLLCMAALVWSYNWFRLKNVSFVGLTRYTEAEFREKLEDSFWCSITPVFCLQDTTRQKEIPFIEKYEIEYVDQHSARIQVHEKRVTGCVLVMGRYMYFDKDGIIVESSESMLEGIPVVTGLEFKEIVLHQKLKVQKERLFDTILNLTRLIEQQEITVQEIFFDSNYEVTLYVEDITVLLGKKENYDETINALTGILKVISGQKGTLDMRNYSMENQDVIFREIQ